MSKPTDQEIAVFSEELLAYAPGRDEHALPPKVIEQALAPYGGLATESIYAEEQRRRHEAFERQITMGEIKAQAADANAALKGALAKLEASSMRERKQVQSLLDPMRKLGELLAAQVASLDDESLHEDEPSAFDLPRRIERTCQFVDFVVLEVRNTLSEDGQAV